MQAMLEAITKQKPFWELEPDVFDEFNHVGVRSEWRMIGHLNTTQSAIFLLQNKLQARVPQWVGILTFRESTFGLVQNFGR